jgi:hypothetical protein
VTEGSKTGVFALIAGAVALLAWVTTAKNTVDETAASQKDKVLFEKFNDPLDASSLKIVKFDTNKQATVEFEVTKDQKSGLWSIPSRDNYPADANKQMAEAATLFVGLKSLDVASEKRVDQQLYGVLEPNTQKEQGGDGVGMLVQMRDAKGNSLVDIIIGKETDDKKRFLRVPNEDVIYVANIDPRPLSTDFKQWIEDDLLKLSSNDIEQIGIRDYQIVPTNQGLAVSRNYEADLRLINANGQWEPIQITTYGPEGKGERKLTDQEQLSATKLNDMKSALDRVKLADVAKKPSGLAADLKADRTKLSNEAKESLAKRGFYPDPQQKEGDIVDFYSENGEIIVTLKNGVQYLLRLGGSAGADISQPIEKGEEAKISINRFLLVTCRLEESQIPPVDLEKVPETVEELKALEQLQKAAATGTQPLTPTPNPTPDQSVPPTPESQAKSEETPAKSDEAKPADDKSKGDNPAAETPSTEKPVEPPKDLATEPPKEEPKDPSKSISAVDPNKTVLVSAVSQEDAKGTESQPPATTEPPAAPAPTQATNPAPAAQASSEPTEQEWKERLEAKKDAVTKSNQRKLEERTEKLNSAKNKVAELNRRFADWYYIISEEDYSKLKMKLDDLIQPKTSASSAPAAPTNFGPPGLGGGFQP